MTDDHRKSIFFANLLLFVGGSILVLDSISALRMAEVLPVPQTEISDEENEFLFYKSVNYLSSKRVRLSSSSYLASFRNLCNSRAGFWILYLTDEIIVVFN